MGKLKAYLKKVKAGMESCSIALQPFLRLLAGWGRTRVMLAYLGAMVAVVASSSVSFDFEQRSVHLETGSISLITVLMVIVVTIPVILYFSVNKGENEKKIEGKTDVFESVYIPNFRKIFDLLNAPHYAYWSYALAVNGSTLISCEQYERLEELAEFCKNRSLHKGYEEWNLLIENIGNVVGDIVNVFDLHLASWGEEKYTFERFYKKYSPNPNYHSDLEAYREEVLLISDLMLELTRICNLLLAKVRERNPDFLSEVGVLYIRDVKDREDKDSRVEYELSEISAAPYPGLIEFLSARGKRRHYFSKTADVQTIFPDGIFWMK